MRARRRSPGPGASVPVPPGSIHVDASVDPEPAAVERALPQPAASTRRAPEDDRLTSSKTHGAPIPAITFSRVVCRATHATAIAPASANPASTATISSPLAPSDNVT